jgi:geranylgeranyl transferase type-2 subunit alpha
MHGVRRTWNQTIEQAQRYEQWSAEARQVLQQRYALSRECFLKRSEPVLLRNPEEYSLWNRRKACLVERYRLELATASENAGLSPSPALREQVEAEFRATEAALRQNPKSYATWAHRLWLLRAVLPLSPDSTSTAVPGLGNCQWRPPWVVPLDLAQVYLAREEALCKQLLALDDRNFLGWRHLVEVLTLTKGIGLELSSSSSSCGEGGAPVAGAAAGKRLLHITRTVLDQNSCNYTAYHYRSIAVKEAPQDFDWLEELDALHQVMYTEPNDQSVWFYYHWCMEQLQQHRHLDQASHTQNQAHDHRHYLEKELDLLDALLELEPTARWALEAKARHLMNLGQHKEAARILGEELPMVDPLRKGMYEELADACMRNSLA